MDGIKAVSADGKLKLSADEIKMLAGKSLEKVKTGMSEASKDLITTAGLELETLIAEQVKKAVAAIHAKAA